MAAPSKLLVRCQLVVKYAPSGLALICYLQTLLSDYLLSQHQLASIRRLFGSVSDELLVPFPNFVFLLIARFIKHDSNIWYLYVSLIFLFVVVPIALLTGFLLKRLSQSWIGLMAAVLLYALISWGALVITTHVVFSS